MTIEINNPNRRIIYSRENDIVQVKHYIDTFEYNECVIDKVVTDLESFDMQGVSKHVSRFMREGVLNIPMQVYVYDNGKKILSWIQHEMEI